MTYCLPYQAEDLLRNHFFKLREIMDPKVDEMTLSFTSEQLVETAVDEMYKNVLKLDGQYRLLTNSWTAPAAKIRLTPQL